MVTSSHVKKLEVTEVKMCTSGHTLIYHMINNNIRETGGRASHKVVQESKTEVVRTRE